MPLKQACSSHVTFTELPPVQIEQITGPLVLPTAPNRKYNNEKRAAKAQRRARSRNPYVIRKATGQKCMRSVRKFKTQRTKINNLVLRQDADLFFTERRNVVKQTALTPAHWWGGSNCCQNNCADGLFTLMISPKTACGICALLIRVTEVNMKEESFWQNHLQSLFYSTELMIFSCSIWKPLLTISFWSLFSLSFLQVSSFCFGERGLLK